MSDLEERSSKLSATITRLEKQKAEGIQDAERLTDQIIAGLITGENVDQLLATRQLKLALAEAIPAAVAEVQRQLEEVQRAVNAERDRQQLEQLETELTAARTRFNELDRLIYAAAGPTREERIIPYIPERDQLAQQIRGLERQINELRFGRFSILRDNPGGLERHHTQA